MNSIAARIAHLELTTADLALLAEMRRQVDAGDKKPNWAEAARQLEAPDASNLRKAALKLADKDLFTVEPFAMSGEALSFLSGGSAGSGGGITGIARAKIHPSPLNPRKTFDEDALAQLAASIAAKGVLQPILVRPHPKKPGEFEIAAGERRWRASGIAKLDELPALVRDMDDAELVTIAITENRDRSDVHPLEEADGYLMVLKLREGEDDADKVTAELAAAANYKDKRIVQRRIQMARSLTPKVRKAFLGGQINLAQAEAVMPYPAKLQDDALKPMMEGWGSWSTGKGVRDMMRGQGLAEEYALFSRDDYKGAVAEESDGSRVFLDRAEAETLQRAALDAEVKAAKERGLAFVQVCKRYFDYCDYADADETDATDGGDVGIQFQLIEETLKVRIRYARKRKQVGKAKPAKGADKPAEGPQPYERRHFRQARADKTHRLQQGVATNDRLAAAIATIGLLPASYGSYENRIGRWIGGYQRGGDDSAVPFLTELRVQLKKISDQPDGFKLEDERVTVTDEHKALTTLMAADNLAKIFSAAVAAQAGSWPGFSPDAGDAPIVVSIADILGDAVPPFLMTADYLKVFTIDQLRRIAAGCISEDAAAAMPAKKAKAVSFILEHKERDIGWVPPEIAFASPAEAHKAITRHLDPPKPKAAPKPKEKAKAPAAAKPEAKAKEKAA